ncbi:MAG: hypothetical protein ACK5KT_10330 [Dysgonomonas sp.]
MSIYYLFVFFICLNISGYFLVKHSKESALFKYISIISCIIWAITIGLTAYIYFVSSGKSLVYGWAISVVSGFISTLSILLIKLVNYYKK